MKITLYRTLLHSWKMLVHSIKSSLAVSMKDASNIQKTTALPKWEQLQRPTIPTMNAKRLVRKQYRKVYWKEILCFLLNTFPTFISLAVVEWRTRNRKLWLVVFFLFFFLPCSRLRRLFPFSISFLLTSLPPYVTFIILVVERQ